MITIYRHPHRVSGLKKFPELFKSCDILFVELGTNNYKKRVEEYLNGLSQGKNVSTLPLKSFEYTEFLEKLIRGSGKRIVVEDSPFSKEFFNLYVEQPIENAVLCLREGKLEDARDWFLECARWFNFMNEKRENQIVDQLSKLQEEVGEKEILVLIGASHGPLYWKLRERGMKVKQILHSNPLRFSYVSEAFRRHRFGKPLSLEIIVKALTSSQLEYILRKEFEEFGEINTGYRIPEDISNPEDGISWVARKIVEENGMEDLLKFWWGRNE